MSTLFHFSTTIPTEEYYVIRIEYMTGKFGSFTKETSPEISTPTPESSIPKVSIPKVLMASIIFIITVAIAIPKSIRKYDEETRQYIFSPVKLLGISAIVVCLVSSAVYYHHSHKQLHV